LQDRADRHRFPITAWTCARRTGWRLHRNRCEIQNLIERLAVSDQSGLLKLRAGTLQLRDAARQLATQRRFGIPTQSVGVGYGDQE
jgi:hypothetical protein